MFEESLLESTPLLHTRNRAPALISFAVQAAIATALILIPLLHPEVLPLAAPRLQLLAPRYTPPRPPRPAPQPVRVQLATTTSASSAPTPAAPRIQRQAFQTDAQTVDQPALPVGLNLGAAGPSQLSALTGTAPTGSRVAVTPAPAAAPALGRLHVSQGVTAGLLIDPIRPVYPAIARISHSQGTVVIQAIISKSGHIESARVLSGPILFQAAALEALRDARYRPFLLNGQPTEVETTISINFRMGD